jgi:hypothetical protein
VYCSISIQVLNVADARLVILASGPPNVSAEDRSDLDRILNSLEIGGPYA